MTITQDQEALFEVKAKRLLQYLKSNIRYDKEFMPRPFFIEITGSPSAGKTTTITELDKFFRRMGFRVWRPQEGAEVIRHITRDTPVYNIRTGLYALSLLLDLSRGHQYDLVIFDRAIFDAYVWMMYWEEKQKLLPREKELYQNFFLSRLWINEIDAAYFMVCNPEDAMQRELRIALSQKAGETSNPKTIATLVSRYEAAYKVLSPTNPNLHLLNTTTLGEQEMVSTIAEQILSTLEAKNLNGS
ncbi:MAG: AAA family ATPase [Candidatus Paceibacterota bacterium]|jgi:thymidylate kinase